MGNTVPRSSIPSMAKRMQGLRVDNKDEKALLVRIGTLIDAIVAAQRGGANAPGSIQRKANVNNLNKPNPLEGSTENIFNGASVKIEPTSSAANLSHYEAQIDSDPNFSSPTSKEIFTTSTTFKGLTSATEYHIRIRPITKNGQIGDWALLDSILTTGQTSGADFDGTSLGASATSKTFTFSSSTQDMFNATSGGLQTIQALIPVTGSAEFLNYTAADTEYDFIARRGTTAVEAATLQGIAPTAVDGKGDGIATVVNASNQMILRRYNPLIFFNLMQAASGASFPVNYTFDVQVQIAGAGFATSTQDTTWVQF
jgi:hypothetical protein